MNEQQNINTSPKPKKKRSLWWLKLLLILVLFAAGIIAGIMLSSQEITNQVMDRFFPQYENTQPVEITPAPKATESPVIEFTPKVSPTPAPTKPPLEIVSPEAKEPEEKPEVTESPEPSAPALPAFAPIDGVVPAETDEPELIGIDAALEAALKHAKLDEEDVTVYSVSREKDDGLVYYEIEFSYNGRDYEYEVNAYTGEIEGWKAEREEVSFDPAGRESSINLSSDYISLETAKLTALEHAGYRESDVSNLSATLEIERNKLVYDVEFRAGGYEYDYKIDATTGDIVSREKDIDRD